MTLAEAQDIAQRHAPHSYYADHYRGMETNYLPQLCAHLEGLEPQRALDIGPGWGTMMVWLAAHGWEVLATDHEPVGHYITPRLVAVAGARYVQHNIFDGPLPYGHFDLITMTQVIPHLKWQPIRALRNCAAMLAPSGLLVVSALDVQDYEHVEATYGTDWRAVPEYGDGEPSPDMVVCMYSQASLHEILSEVFADVEVWKPEGSTVLFGRAQ